MLILFLSPDRFHLPPHGQHIQYRYQQEKSSAIFGTEIWKSPDISNSYCTSGCRQDKAY